MPFEIKKTFSYFLSLRGLLTVPGLMALAITALGGGLIYIDDVWTSKQEDLISLLPWDKGLLETILSTVATASITTLSLVYSIALVVFTLAAGNIGPRLLQRFSRDRTNQITAGLLSGTYLFSLMVLYFLQEENLPVLSLFAIGILTYLSVLQLIFFVHSASRRVTIDQEVASIAEKLEASIDKLYIKGHETAQQDRFPETDYKIRSKKSGYFTGMNKSFLVGYAQKNNLFLHCKIRHGKYCVKGEALFSSSLQIDDKGKDSILESISFADFRSSDDDVEFLIGLLSEIALRALSPGVNDTYTAIACVDKFTSAMVKTAGNADMQILFRDEKANPRLSIPHFSFAQMMKAFFGPLRQVSSNNLLMLQHLTEALGRLDEISSFAKKHVVRYQAERLLEQMDDSDLIESDKIDLQERIGKILNQ